MKITYYLYNAFTIEWDDKKIAIDPGALFAYWFSFASLIPRDEWKEISHIFVTHGDPDHYFHADRVAASGAKIIFNTSMVEERDGQSYMLGPRSKGLTFDTPVYNFHTLSVDESIVVDRMQIRGILSTHGPLSIKLGPFKKTIRPGPEERIGRGNMGFEIAYHEKTLVNLGDTLLHKKEWESLQSPDVLMIPIGGGEVENTMDEFQALEAVAAIQPKLVIPMHYNCPILFRRRGNPANDKLFKREVEKMGAECKILKRREHVLV